MIDEAEDARRVSSTAARWIRRVAQAGLAMMIVLAGWAHGILYVEGGSMRPALAPGDVIVYRRVAPSLEVGDMVVFQHGGALVVHRVAGVLRDGTMRTAGDANDSLDSTPLDPADVRGEVVIVIPAGVLAGRLAGTHS